jgi:alpha-glucosidase
MQLGALIRFMLFFGLADSLRALRFAFWRDRLDRRYRRSRTRKQHEALPPGNLQWGRSIPHGAEIQFDHTTLELLLLAPDVLRITWKPGALPIPYAVVGNNWPGDTTRLEQDQDLHRLTGTQLNVEIAPDGGLNIFNNKGTLLRSEKPPNRTGETWDQQAALDAQACIFGLGERACGWNLRGGTYKLWNQDPGGSYGQGDDPLYMSIPMYTCLQSVGSYMLFYENPHRGELTFDEQVRVSFERGALRSYLFTGSPGHTLDRYTQLTGRAPMPPRWSLGYHQSRWGYRSEDEIRQVTDRFKQNDLPISAIHLDIDYMDGYRVFTVDQARFGHLNELAAELDEDGVKLVAILDPGVKVDRGYAVYMEGLRRGVYCRLPNGRPMLSIVWPGWVHFPDFTRPDVRDWWGAFYPRLLDQGIAGLWHDMNEPSTFAPWGDKTFPLATQHALETQGGDHASAHNLYALLMNRAGFEALQKHRPEHRPWMLSRAGYAGGQRYAWNWTGDVETSWGALRQSIATMLGVSLSGFAYTGSDIGGFSGSPDAELYLRWFQLGVFSPFFRTHSATGTAAREPWMFNQETLDAVRQLLRLRYRLMPYLYTLAWQAHRTGQPLMLPTFWADPEDPVLWEIADQFFLGPALLVAPVLTEGERQREVCFPPGTWYDLWEGNRFEGGRVNLVPADLQRIPAFIPAGSIFPMEISPSELELRLYLPAEGSLEGKLYSDAGDGFLAYRVDHFEGSRYGDELKLDHTHEGQFPWPYTKIYISVHGAKLKAVKADGKICPVENNTAQIPLFDQLEIQLT